MRRMEQVSAAMHVGQTTAGAITGVRDADGDDDNMLALVAGLQNLASAATASQSEEQPVPLNPV